MEAKERFPRAPSEKTDWIKACNKKSGCFSANKGWHSTTIGFLVGNTGEGFLPRSIYYSPWAIVLGEAKVTFPWVWSREQGMALVTGPVSTRRVMPYCQSRLRAI